MAHEIDYKIIGNEMQAVEIELDPQESVIAESGAMMSMKADIEMATIFGDGSKDSEKQGLFGKMVGAGKRLLTGESLFMTIFTHTGQGKSHVTFAAPYPGKIIPIDLKKFQGKIICQKDAFLCAAKGVSVGVEFQKKLGTGFFGGEGFIMQKLEGDGVGFIHAGGSIIEHQLQAGEVLKVDTGCLVAFTKDVSYEIEFVGGIKNTVFGGEGLFFVKVTGPGTVYLQTLPFSRLASRIFEHAPQAGGNRQGEGSVLGNIGGIINGDNF